MPPNARGSERPEPLRLRALRRRAVALFAGLRLLALERAGVRFLVPAISRNFDVGAP